MNQTRFKNDTTLNIILAGAGITFVLSTILATVVFDRVSPNSTLTPQDIVLGMEVKATDQHIEVFFDAGLNFHYVVDIADITKLDEEGNDAAGTIADLFPFADPVSGKGSLLFKIKTVGSDKMPDWSNVTEAVKPMAYIKEENYGEFIKSFLKLSAVGIKSFNLILICYILLGLGMIGVGAAIIYFDLKNTAVETMMDDDEEE